VNAFLFPPLVMILISAVQLHRSKKITSDRDIFRHYFWQGMLVNSGVMLLAVSLLKIWL
jgi:hypothetical protein